MCSPGNGNHKHAAKYVVVAERGKVPVEEPPPVGTGPLWQWENKKEPLVSGELFWVEGRWGKMRRG